ncbi:hypothetical protein CU664_08690 [Pseudomonas syringae pv. actinidifoliorum]|nr:hypothetical protein [Pseudomonas syringae pv. actinidifoliorum]NAT63361.1 hypothetical protein [Pseudomonas syringae pv. actinidifoliorum]
MASAYPRVLGCWCLVLLLWVVSFVLWIVLLIGLLAGLLGMVLLVLAYDLFADLLAHENRTWGRTNALLGNTD